MPQSKSRNTDNKCSHTGYGSYRDVLDARMWEHLADAIKDEDSVELSKAALGYNQLALAAHEPKRACRNAGGVVDLYRGGSSLNTDRNIGPYLVFVLNKKHEREGRALPRRTSA